MRALLVTASMIFAIVSLRLLGAIPAIPAYTSVNQPLTPVIPARGPTGRDRTKTNAMRASPMESARTDSQSGLFVGIGISGGGSRAAVFGAAVLRELDSLGFLRHTKVISSVSGGSLPAAYFAINGPQIGIHQTWDDVIAKMSESFRKRLILKQIQPHKLFQTLFTDLDRTDLLAEVFDERLFDGTTYEQLADYGPRSPVLVVNATEIGGRQSRYFPFTVERFRGYRSRIDTYPISHAVAASAAFPGLLNSVTIEAWPPQIAKKELQSYYVHLIDGGALDNLGARSLMAAARTYWEQANTEEFKCFMFVIDAYVETARRTASELRDLRDSPLDFVVDGNVFDAIDSLSLRRRYSDLGEIGVTLPDATYNSVAPTYDPEWPRRSSDLRKSFYVGESGRGGSLVTSYRRVVEVPISRHPERPSLSANSRKPHQNCTVWHIALNELRSLSPDSSLGTGPAVETSDDRGTPNRDNPILMFRNNLWQLISRIDTDFELSGPEGCSPALIKEALVDAARVLVVEDRDSLRRTCQWFFKSYPDAEFQCDLKDYIATKKELPITLAAVGSHGDVSVRCRPVDAD